MDPATLSTLTDDELFTLAEQIQRQQIARAAEKRRTERDAKRGVITKLRKRLKALEKQYEALHEAEYTETATITLRLDVNLECTWDDLTPEDGLLYDEQELFEFGVGVTVLGKLSDDDATIVKDAVADTINEMCFDGLRILCPKTFARLEKFTDAYRQFCEDVRAAGVEPEDFQEDEEEGG